MKRIFKALRVIEIFNLRSDKSFSPRDVIRITRIINPPSPMNFDRSGGVKIRERCMVFSRVVDMNVYDCGFRANECHKSRCFIIAYMLIHVPL